MKGVTTEISGIGNGPIDAFFNALQAIGVEGYEFINYHEHAISRGSDSKAISYIELKVPGDGHIFGIGIASNINLASILGVLNAINRAIEQKLGDSGKTKGEIKKERKAKKAM